MGKSLRGLLFVLIFCSQTLALGKLEFDSRSNKVKIYGPYVKYNILRTPYSVARYQFALSDIRLEMGADEDGDQKIFVIWPRFLMNFGQIKLINKKNRNLLIENFSADDIGEDEKYGRYPLDDSGKSLLETLKEPFQVCLKQVFEKSKVRVCSDVSAYNGSEFKSIFTGVNKSASLLNGKKAPKNAQISLAENQKKLNLVLKFKSGFLIEVKDKIRQINIDNVIVDPREKRLGIVDGKGAVRPTQLTTKDQFFSFIKEQNYFKNQYEGSQDWPQDLEDAEMEFAPYLVGASMQLYGLIVSRAPPPFEFRLNKEAPIATYSRNVELRGTKAEKEVLAAKNENELFINQNQKEFLWNYSAPKKGEINRNYLSLQHKEKDFYFSKRIFRAHQTALSAAAALSTTEALGIVPGYNIAAEHWFEELWNKSKYSYQRWGIAANVYETAQGFKPNKNYSGKLSVNPINFDILFRLSPGVRPVQSSFGIGLRYLNFTIFQSQRDDIVTRLIGVGGFWQTAPQKIVDDIFNIVPFFRYPKWMELSFFYYPLILSGQELGFSFSWQARGKMFFSKNWFIDTSFNLNAVTITQPTANTVVSQKLGLGTAHGTIGLGYLF